jgi:acyl carrier protein
MGKFANMSEVLPELMLLFQNELNVDVPSADTDLVESGLLDSLMLVDLLVAIENKFNVSLPLEEVDLEQLRDARRLANMLQRLLAEKDAA